MNRELVNEYVRMRADSLLRSLYFLPEIETKELSVWRNRIASKELRVYMPGDKMVLWIWPEYFAVSDRVVIRDPLKSELGLPWENVPHDPMEIKRFFDELEKKLPEYFRRKLAELEEKYREYIEDARRRFEEEKRREEEEKAEEKLTEEKLALKVLNAGVWFPIENYRQLLAVLRKLGFM